jgi:hypothetical protein
MFPLQFGQLPERDSLLRYRDRLQGRDAYKRAAERDDEAQQQMQPAQSQPAQPQPAQS